MREAQTKMLKTGVGVSVNQGKANGSANTNYRAGTTSCQLKEKQTNSFIEQKEAKSSQTNFDNPSFENTAVSTSVSTSKINTALAPKAAKKASQEKIDLSPLKLFEQELKRLDRLRALSSKIPEDIKWVLRLALVGTCALLMEAILQAEGFVFSAGFAQKFRGSVFHHFELLNDFVDNDEFFTLADAISSYVANRKENHARNFENEELILKKFNCPLLNKIMKPKILNATNQGNQSKQEKLEAQQRQMKLTFCKIALVGNLLHKTKVPDEFKEIVAPAEGTISGLIGTCRKEILNIFTKLNKLLENPKKFNDPLSGHPYIQGLHNKAIESRHFLTFDFKDLRKNKHKNTYTAPPAAKGTVIQPAVINSKFHFPALTM